MKLVMIKRGQGEKKNEEEEEGEEEEERMMLMKERKKKERKNFLLFGLFFCFGERKVLFLSRKKN